MSIETQKEPTKALPICQLCGTGITKPWHIAYRTRDQVVDLHAWCVVAYEKSIKS